MQYKNIIRVLGILVGLFSVTMLPPALVSLIFRDGGGVSFLMAFFLCLITGLLAWYPNRHEMTELRSRDGFLIVVLFWMVLGGFSAVPLTLLAHPDLSFTDALFEGISGITTTGASVLDDIDNLPKAILYYRAQLNFLGGLGIIVLAMAVAPFLGIGGAKLYQSEMPGPMKEEKMTPRLADTAKNLWMIYSGLALSCAVSYYLAGMNWFDALCHSLSTVSLGGFSTHGSSLGFFNSPAIEMVGGVYSIFAAVNFALYFVAISRRSLRPILANSEFQFFSLILSLVVGVTCLELYRTGTFEAHDALVHGFFQATSIMTDNGLGAGDYPSWPAHIVLLLLGASFFGGCVGSTCGGIKALRFLLLYRQGSREVSQLVHPSGVFLTKVSGHSVPDRVIQSVWSLFFFYIFFSCIFVWGMVAIGYDFVTAFGTVAACINNMGVGYGETAAGFGTLKDPAKWLMCVAMLFGRLEIFPILIVMSRAFR